MDAEWMVSGFRRVLRGVCDCEFLLDHELKIRGALAIFTTEVYSWAAQEGLKEGLQHCIESDLITGK